VREPGASRLHRPDGDTRGTDTADRPIWPALFITDITANSGACTPADYNNPAGKTCCDWQALTDPTLSRRAPATS